MSFINSAESTIPITIPFNGLDTNMKIRLYADIAKDLAVKTTPPLSPSDINAVIGTLYSESAIKKNGANVNYGSSYDVLIKVITNDLAGQVSKQTTTLKNVMRSNGVSSNIKISNATHVFYESGDSPKSVCIRSDITQISTPASILDTAGKVVAENSLYYPEGAKQLVFDSDFLKQCGFPGGMRWEYDGSTKRVKIVYSSQPPPVVIDSEIGISQSLRGDFEQYSQGNVEKNAEIARLKTNMTPVNQTRMNVILMTKEFADVAQVLVYYAYVVEQASKGEFNKASVVMITTDSVVYYLCLALNLSCIYTGARVGVTSGGCNLSYFEAGTPDYLSQLKSIILNEYNDINASNYSMITSYNTVIADFSLIRFIDGGSVVRLTGTATPSTKSGQNIIEGIRGLIAEIQTTNDQLKALYDAAKTQLDGIGAQITADYLKTFYEDFRTKARALKLSPQITRTKIDGLNNYIISNESLIQSFRDAAATITRSTRSRGSSRKGGQRGGVCNQSTCDDVEFLKIVIFIWYQWYKNDILKTEIYINTDTITTSFLDVNPENEDFNKTLFIIYYERYVHNPFGNESDFESCVTYLDSITEEEVLSLGNLIIHTSGMDLAPDDSVQKIIADYGIYKAYLESATDLSEWTGRTRRGGVAVFQPDDGCVKTDDLILIIRGATPHRVVANGITAYFNNPLKSSKKEGKCFDVISIITYTLQFHDWYLQTSGARDVYELEIVLSSFWIPYKKPETGELMSGYSVKVLPETAAKINIFINSRIPHLTPPGTPGTEQGTEQGTGERMEFTMGRQKEGGMRGKPKTRKKSKNVVKKNKRRANKKTRKRK